jgi:outer membrane protein OmpA-like peptidoglycan-associated protein
MIDKDRFLIGCNFFDMKTLKSYFLGIVILAAVFSGCKSMTGTQKGAAIGVAGGAAAGAIIGKASGNTGLGAIIGATVGGATGAVIGNQMDKQADKMKKEVPDAKVVRVGEGIVVEMPSSILFGFDSSVLSAEAKNNIDKMVTVFNDYPDTNIEIQGHTDSKGTDKYNQSLSVSRSSSVSSYLSSKSIASFRLTSIGYGESLPKYSNETADGRTQNRRVEFLITANEKMKADAEKAAKSN